MSKLLFKGRCGFNDVYHQPHIPGREIHVAETFFGQDGAAAIIASVNIVVGDWAAYMGGVPASTSKEDLILMVLAHGGKLRERHARALFPEISQEWRD